MFERSSTCRQYKRVFDTTNTIATGGLVNPSNEVTKNYKHVILDHG
jgi:hypothetical protein